MASVYSITSFVSIFYFFELIFVIAAWRECDQMKVSVGDWNGILIDEGTPSNASSAAKYTKSQSYRTLRCMLPATFETILEKVQEDINRNYGEEVKEEIKLALEEIKELQNRLITLKKLENFTSTDPDSETWNDHMKKMEIKGIKLNFYEVDWLFSECYLYRRIREIFATKKLLHSFDPFSAMKNEFLENSLPAIKTMFQHLNKNRILNSSHELSEQIIRTETTNLFKCALWGNKLDLSITRGNTSVANDMLSEVRRLDGNILVNDLDSVFKILMDENNSKIIEYVMDNAGMEALTDFCLADLFVTRYGVSKVNFRLKRIPWYISDVTSNDFSRTIETLRNHSDQLFQTMGNRWKNYVDSGVWTISSDTYWTLGLSYTNMSEFDPDLYNSLAKANLIIFKGDLNYRKLIQDRNWDTTTPFHVALGKFHPAPLVALRTCKVDVISGLKIGQAEELSRKTIEWLISSDFALIQFDS